MSSRNKGKRYCSEFLLLQFSDVQHSKELFSASISSAHLGQKEITPNDTCSFAEKITHFC